MTHNALIDSLVQDFSYLSQPFGLLIANDNIEEPLFYSELEEAILEVDGDADIQFGISKFVIIPSTTDYVIKIPFNGRYEYYDDDIRLYEEEKLDDYTYIIHDGCPYFYSPFSYVADYCEKEFSTYKKLCCKNLEYFVAETRFYKEFPNKIKIFTQEKIIPCFNDCEDRKPTIRSKDIAKRWIKEDCFALDSTWLANCIDYYGEQQTKRFMDYCDNKEPDILADTHLGNLGYRPDDGSPVILDYSGFSD